MKQRCEELLRQHVIDGVKGKKLIFKGLSEVDVYNITAPFDDHGREIIAGRVERRDSEQARIHFFGKVSDLEWEVLPDYPTFDLQDPFVTKINGELILGGVEIYPLPENPEALGWRTIFYRGKDVMSLERFFEGPKGMKDLRLAKLVDGRIMVLTRPQGELGGRGQIGLTYVNQLEELSHELILAAPLLPQFVSEEWGGANAIYPIDSETVGVLGHIACFDEEDCRHYYSMAFTINPQAGTHSEMKLVAVRAEFEAGEAKRPDLEDVIFSGGLVDRGDGSCDLYVGVGDSHAQVMTVANPFS